MKKFPLLCMLSLLFFSCSVEKKVSAQLVYKKGDTVFLGKNELEIPRGCDFAFDKMTGKGWIHKPLAHSSEFTCIDSNGRVEKTFVVDYEKGMPVQGGPGFFVSNNVALFSDLEFKGISFFLVDLNNRTSQIITVDNRLFSLLCDFSDGKLFIFNFDENALIVYDPLTQEQRRIQTELSEYGFIPEKHVLVGLNERGEICIQDYQSGTVFNTNIKGMKGRSLGFIRERYYVTDRHLYFSKKDVGYSIKYLIPGLLVSFTCLGNSRIPHVWYRYSFAGGTIEKIETDNPFIEILGVIDE